MEQLEMFPEFQEPKVKLIGLTGFAGAGKSKFAEIAQELDSRVEVLSLANPLKQKTAAFAGVEVGEIHRNKEQWRPLLVALGTAARSHLGADFWLNLLIHSYSDTDPESTVIIDDVRHENEAAWIRQGGGSIIRVERLGQYTPPLPQRDVTERPESIDPDLHVFNDPAQPGLLKQTVKDILWHDGLQKAEQMLSAA